MRDADDNKAPDAIGYERRLRFKRALRLWLPLVVTWAITAIGLSRLAGLRQADLGWFDLTGGLLMGLIFGTVMAWTETRGLSNGRLGAPPWVDLLARASLYTGVILLAILGVRAALYEFFPEELTREVPRTLDELWSDRRVRRFVMLLFGATFAINFLLHLRLVIGPRHLSALFTGRYRRPQLERRCFVFVDLIDSTPTALRLGPLEFTHFKHDFFSDLAEPLLVTGGHIVQYVGDEVMLTWRERELRRGSEPLAFVTALEARLRRRAPAYEARYGTRPRFRTGIHYGEVVVAQVGDTRRDIVYSGDVVNAGARLLQACRGEGVDGLISAVAAARLSPNGQPVAARLTKATNATIALSLKPRATILLRGRAEEIEVSGWTWSTDVVAGGSIEIASDATKR